METEFAVRSEDVLQLNGEIIELVAVRGHLVVVNGAGEIVKDETDLLGTLEGEVVASRVSLTELCKGIVPETISKVVEGDLIVRRSSDRSFKLFDGQTKESLMAVDVGL